MEVRFCCEQMYNRVLWNNELLALLKEECVKYCPFCGAKITETQCYKKSKEEEA